MVLKATAKWCILSVDTFYNATNLLLQCIPKSILNVYITYFVTVVFSFYMISMSNVQFQFQGPFIIFVLLHEAILSAKSSLIFIEMIDIPIHIWYFHTFTFIQKTIMWWTNIYWPKNKFIRQNKQTAIIHLIVSWHFLIY